MLRRILLPLDGSARSDSATRFACSIAQAHDAEITGLVVLNTPEMVEEGRLPFNLQLLDMERRGYFKLKKEAQKRIEMILQQFESVCEAQGVRYRKAELQGIPSKCILDESIYYDLIVVGMLTHFCLNPDKEGGSLEEMLDHSIVPILAVPEDLNVINIEKVVITFNGSFHSAKALRDFVPFCRGFKLEVTLLMSDEDEDHASHCLSEAVEFLKINGISNVVQKRTGKNIIKALEEDYIDHVDLVVAGLHSKNAFLQFFIGSFVKYLLKVQKVPVLLG